MIHARTYTPAFALPSVLIASVVMLMVLVTAVTAVGASRTALESQYYNQLAVAAAESGLKKAEICIRQNDYVMQWVNAGRDLTPQTNCSGTVVSGSSQYVYQDSNTRTAFAITRAEIQGPYYSIEARGTTERLRTSTGAPWRIYSQTMHVSMNYVAAYATKSASGFGQVCGIINGEAWCWGTENSWGKIGDGTTDDALVPSRVVRADGVLAGKTDTDIAIGNAFACVVSGGEVYCWGRNHMGQLGNGTVNEIANPNPIKVHQATGALAGKTVTQIVAGGRHACALTTEGRVYCWGSNVSGQLGNNSTTNSSVPVAVNTTGVLAGKTVTKIAAVPDVDATCALANGEAYCWGSNASGELGIGSTVAYRAVPQQIGGLLAGRTVTDIALSAQTGPVNAHACAVANGEAYCWGSNNQGMLGNNSTTDSRVPVKVHNSSGALAGKTVTRVVTGHPHSCALTTEIRAYCWGGNAQGQLGINNASVTSSPVPLAVYTGTDGGYGLGTRVITDITGGGNRGCVIASGTNFCWGLNSQYQIGDGTNIHRYRPTVASYLEQRQAPIMY